MKSRLLPQMIVLAIAGALLSLAIACSSSPTPAPASNALAATPVQATEATTPPTEAPEARTIKLGFSAWPGWFPWQVTEEAGLSEEAGVDVELVWFEGYLDSINAFAAGQLDANSQTLNDTLASIAVGDPQVIVLANDNSTGNDQIIVDESIQSIEELAGRRIGVEVGVVDHFLLLLGLDSVGMTESDVEIVPLETGAAAAAFAAGQLDAVGVFAPFTTQALKRESSHVLFTSADFPGSIPDHLVVSQELIDEYPEGVQKLVDAWFLTIAYMAANPEETIAIRAERAGVTPEEYGEYDAGTTLFSIDDNLATFSEGSDYGSLYFAAQEIPDFLVASEFVETRPELAGAFDTTFIDAAAR